MNITQLQKELTSTERTTLFLSIGPYDVGSSYKIYNESYSNELEIYFSKRLSIEKGIKAYSVMLGSISTDAEFIKVMTTVSKFHVVFYERGPRTTKRYHATFDKSAALTLLYFTRTTIEHTSLELIKEFIEANCTPISHVG